MNSNKSDLIFYQNVYDNFAQQFKDLSNLGDAFVIKDNKFGLGKNQSDDKKAILFSTLGAFRNLNKYKERFKNHNETELKARVIFDVLGENGSKLTFEKNAFDVLPSKITRCEFYANFFNRMVRDADFEINYLDGFQMIFIPFRQNTNDKPIDISDEDYLNIRYSRALYHELTHIKLNTGDERKCYAILKIMKQYPQHSMIIFDMFLKQRTRMSKVFKTMRDIEHGVRKPVRCGIETYLMPTTFGKLKPYAKNPSTIPDSDTDLLNLVFDITKKSDFTDKQWRDLKNLLKQNDITSPDIQQTEIAQICVNARNNLQK